MRLAPYEWKDKRYQEGLWPAPHYHESSEGAGTTEHSAKTGPPTTPYALWDDKMEAILGFNGPFPTKTKTAQPSQKIPAWYRKMCSSEDTFSHGKNPES